MCAPSDAARVFFVMPSDASEIFLRRSPCANRAAPNQSHASSFAASPIASIALIPV